MGCDIHAILERKNEDGWWINAGDPDLGRNYELFSVLANVRNRDDISYISEPKGLPEDCCSEFSAYYDDWRDDAHSTSWLMLKELKAFDLDQEYYDRRLVMSRDQDGNITATCRDTTGKHLGEVGRTKIFSTFGRGTWDRLIAEMERLADGDDESVRLVFFFDN